MKKGSIVSKVFCFILLIAFVILYLVTAVIDLISLSGAKQVDSYNMEITESGISVEGDFYYLTSGPILTVTHKMSYIIPMGTEYYFALANDPGTKCIFVRASEGFAEDFYKELDENEFNGTNAGVLIKGKVREMRPKVKNELYSYAEELASDGYQVISNGNTFLYIDATTQFQSILRIVAALVFVAVAVMIMIAIKVKRNAQLSEAPKPIAIAVLLLILFGVGLMMYTLSFIEL